MSRIRNTGQTSIRNLGYIISTLKHVQENWDFLLGIVLVKTDLLGLNPKMLKQKARISRIFSRNPVDLFQGIDHTDAHIIQIADRSRDQIEFAVGSFALKTFLNLHHYSLNNNSSQNMHSASFSRR